MTGVAVLAGATVFDGIIIGAVPAAGMRAACGGAMFDEDTSAGRALDGMIRGGMAADAVVA